MDSQEGWAQLMVLRQVTEMTGALHEAQVLQLKMWPLVAAPHAASSEFTWDGKKKEIDFTLTLNKKKRPPKDLVERFKGFDRSVKAMLGEDWLVRIKVNGAVIFRGRRKNNVGKGTGKGEVKS